MRSAADVASQCDGVRTTGRADRRIAGALEVRARQRCVDGSTAEIARHLEAAASHCLRFVVALRGVVVLRDATLRVLPVLPLVWAITSTVPGVPINSSSASIGTM